MIEHELTDPSAGTRWSLAEAESEQEAEGSDAAHAPEQKPARPAADADAQTALMPAVKDDEAAPAPPAKTEKTEPPAAQHPAKAATVRLPAPAPAPEKPAASGAAEQNAADGLGIWTKTMPARPRHRLPAPPRTEPETAEPPGERRGRHADFESSPKPQASAEAPSAPAEPRSAPAGLTPGAQDLPPPRSAPEAEPEAGPGSTPAAQPEAHGGFDYWSMPSTTPPWRTEPEPAPKAVPAPKTAPKPKTAPAPESASRPAAQADPVRSKPAPEAPPRPASREVEERVARDFDFEHWTKPAPGTGAAIPSGSSGAASAPASEPLVIPPFDDQRSARRDPAPPAGDQDETQVMPALKGLPDAWKNPRPEPVSRTGEESGPGPDDGAGPGATKTAPRPPAPAKSSAPAEAPAADKTAKAAKSPKAAKNAKDAANWRQSIPYDDTGVLIRPKGWSDDDIETALVEMGPLREALAAAQTEARLEAVRAGAEEPAPGLLHRLRSALRPRPRHGVLAAIMVLQSTLTLRNTNSAFEDEGLYLFSGHLELAHLLNGAQIPDYTLYFSGSPVLYPVLGAIADQIGGLFAARLLNLVFMLAATGLLYLVAKRFFGTRAALCAAAIFGTTPSAAFVGGLATYDAPALFLLALSAWIVVRCGSSRWPYYLLVAPLVVLAAATKYAAFLFVPTVIALAGVSAMVYGRRGSAILRSLLLTVFVAILTYGALKLGGSDYLHGIAQTTTARASGGESRLKVLVEAAQWGALPFFASVVGAVYYIFRPTRADDAAPLPGRLGRVLVSLLLVGTALLAPANQIRIETDVALQKHVGFGMLFAAPLAGYALVRMVGEHFRRLQIGIGVLALSLAIGLTQSNELFTSWPDQRPLVSVLKQHQESGAAYLVEDDEPVEYYMRGDVEAEPTQFDNTYAFAFTDAQGQYLSGTDAYLAAIRQGYFQIIALDYTVTAGLDATLVSALQTNSGYKLVATVQESAAEHNGNGYAEYRVWAKI